MGRHSWTPLARRSLLAAAPALAAGSLILDGALAQELRVDITEGQRSPLPIAIPTFVGGGPGEARGLGDIAAVISANLERSGLFRPVDPKSFIQTPQELQIGPRYADWRLAGAQALVAGSVTPEADGRIRVDFRLFDVVSGKEILAKTLRAPPEGWRRIGHLVSDYIYTRLTGESGYFDTRIVYIAESGPVTQRVKRLAIMDQDGENNKFLTDGKVLVLTPRFSPNQQEITYLSYFNNKPRVYLFNIDSGRQELLGDFPGMTFAPRFSPDGNRVVMSLAQNGNTDIYSLDLRTRRQTQLTQGPGIDTGPSFSPDGSRITFESDRGGSQQIYTMNADGSGVNRLTFGAGRYGTPVWSPRGDLIAFTRQSGGKFSVGVIRPDGSGERILTEAFHVEGPTWAPNGRVLMFFKERPLGDGGRQRQVRLYTVDLTGSNERQVVTPTDASDPAWSPLIL